MKSKLIIAGLILAATVSYLVYAGVSQGWVYYLEVDAYLAKPEYRGQTVRLCGRVGAQGLVRDAAGLTARFNLLGKTHEIPVVYHGVVPDMFKPGCEVVVEGKQDKAGVFQSTMMLTKCASKYETEDHAKRLGQRP